MAEKPSYRIPVNADIVTDLTPQLGGDLSGQDTYRIYNLPGLEMTAFAELTLDTDGIIAVTQMLHTVDTFEGAASDDLVTVNGGATVNLIVLKAEHTDRTIVVKHGTGNIWLQGKADISLDDLEDGIMLVWTGTNWIDIAAGGAGGGAGSDTTAIHEDEAGEIVAVTEKTTPVSADVLLVEDSADTNAKKRVQFGRFSPLTTMQGRLTLSSGNPYNEMGGIFVGTTADGAATITSISVNDTPKIVAGMVVSGVNIPADTTVVSVDSTTQITMSANATGSGAKRIFYGAVTLYYSPAGGNKVVLYDGSAWNAHTLTEKSLDISAYTADKNYDIFLYDNAGTLTLEGLVWTDDTTRATALALQDGVYVKSGVATRRYVGTIRICALTGTTIDAAYAEFTDDPAGHEETAGTHVAGRYVWNMYNQTYRSSRGLWTASHTYTTQAWRNWNAYVNAYIGILTGLPSSIQISAQLSTKIDNSTYNSWYAARADSVSAPAFEAAGNMATTTNVTQTLIGGATPTVGYHKLFLAETVNTGGTLTSNDGSVAAFLFV